MTSKDISSVPDDTIGSSDKYKVLTKFMEEFGEILAQNGSKPFKLTKRRRAKVRTSNIKAHDDYFDESIMDSIALKLANTSMLTGLDLSGNGCEVVLCSKVIGRCCPEKNGPVKFLVHWEPGGLIPDEWIWEKDLDEMPSRRIPLNSLPFSSFSDFLDKSQSLPKQRGRKFKRTAEDSEKIDENMHAT